MNRFSHPSRFSFGLVVAAIALGAWVIPGSLGRPSSSASSLERRSTAGNFQVFLPFITLKQSGLWLPTGSLSTARDEQTATLLLDGEVLVVGGVGTNGNPLSSAELYDPTRGTWATTGNLNTARYAQTATLLPNGKVLVAGGLGSGASFDYLSSAELYDPTSGIWSATGNLVTARFYDTATLLSNGKVLIAGGAGYSGSLSSAELYDPISGTFTSTGSMSIARVNHTAALLLNGKALVASGYNSLMDLTSGELYDPTSGTWSGTGSLSMSRFYDTATLLSSGQVLVVGGGGNNYNVLSSAELYNPTSGTWATTGSLSTARYWHTATLLLSGQVLVAGGVDSQLGGNILSSAESYNPTSGTWATTGSLNTARTGHSATLLPSGAVLVEGGVGSNGSKGPLNSAEIYYP